MRLTLILMMSLIGIVSVANADGEVDNHPENVRRVPALGIEVSEEDRRVLEAGLAELNQEIEALRQKKDERTKALLPDVVIFSRAVEDALKYQEFFNSKEIQVAKKHLQRGLERAKQLAKGEAPWTGETGLVVRGYVSRLDDSVQPYGLVIPESYRAGETQPRRLDIWFHGRGETLSENNFLEQKLSQVGYFAPKDTIVLHPFGLWVLKVPMALALGLLAFCLVAIPNLGPVLASIPAILVAWSHGGDTLALQTLGLFVGIETVESYILLPLLQRETVYIPPILSVIAVIFFGAIGGILGAFIAAPMLVVLMVLVKRLYVEELLNDHSVKSGPESES